MHVRHAAARRQQQQQRQGQSAPRSVHLALLRPGRRAPHLQVEQHSAAVVDQHAAQVPGQLAVACKARHDIGQRLHQVGRQRRQQLLRAVHLLQHEAGEGLLGGWEGWEGQE
jgi:hypothetical protein